MKLFIPQNYQSILTLKETELAIKKIKDFFESNLAAELNLVEGDVKNSGEAFQWYRDTSLVGATNSASRTVTIWITCCTRWRAR